METFRVERDNASIKHELEEIKVVSDEVLRAKVIFLFLRREVNVSVLNFGIFLLFIPKIYLGILSCCECLLYKYFRREHEISSLKCDLEDLGRAIDRNTLDKVGFEIC